MEGRRGMHKTKERFRAGFLEIWLILPCKRARDQEMKSEVLKQGKASIFIIMLLMILYFSNFEVSDLAFLRKVAQAAQPIRNPQGIFQEEGVEKMFIFRHLWRNCKNVSACVANTNLLRHFPGISLFAVNL